MFLIKIIVIIYCRKYYDQDIKKYSNVKKYQSVQWEKQIKNY